MEIRQCPNIDLSGLIVPDFIYNRYDLVSQKYLALCVTDSEVEYYVTVALNGKEARIGIWLMKIPSTVLDGIIHYVFDNYHDIRRISYTNGVISRGLHWKSHHFRIELPCTDEELHSRLSRKGRYNIKREKNIIVRQFGSCNIEEYKVEDCPQIIIEMYFQFKYQTHHKEYKMSPCQYLKQFYVTDVYVLRIGVQIGAIVLSCEQCQNVYLENLSYDVALSNYSCGQVLYDMYLSKLIEKGHKSLYLAGGDLEYKKRYGSIEEQTFDCKVYRNESVETLLKTLLTIKHSMQRVRNLIGK